MPPFNNNITLSFHIHSATASYYVENAKNYDNDDLMLLCSYSRIMKLDVLLVSTKTEHSG